MYRVACIWCTAIPVPTNLQYTVPYTCRDVEVPDANDSEMKDKVHSKAFRLSSLKPENVSSKMIAPISSPPSQFKLKWLSVFGCGGDVQQSEKKQSQAVRTYYRKQQKLQKRYRGSEKGKKNVNY